MTQASNLRRVRKEDAPFTERRKDGMDICLDCWTTWMGRYDTDLGAHSQKLLRGESDGYDGNDTSQMRRDNEIAMATDAMISGLPVAQRWAIARKCGIATAWRFPNLDYMTIAIEACQALEAKLKANTATRMLW